MSPPFAPSLICRLRRIPLAAVLQAAGARQDRDDKARWHADAGAISVTGTKFFNWNAGIGGGGAIDLAMHLCGFDFKAAAAWLCTHFPDGRDIPVAVPRPSALRLPAPSPGHLARVVQYLVDERQIPYRLVTQLIDAEDLYADHRANAVFLTRDPRRNPVGAELRGTGPHVWRGMAPGSRKERPGVLLCSQHPLPSRHHLRIRHRCHQLPRHPPAPLLRLYRRSHAQPRMGAISYQPVPTHLLRLRRRANRRRHGQCHEPDIPHHRTPTSDLPRLERPAPSATVAVPPPFRGCPSTHTHTAQRCRLLGKRKSPLPAHTRWLTLHERRWLSSVERYSHGPPLMNMFHRASYSLPPSVTFTPKLRSSLAMQ